jgi:hypothetical protein
MTQSCDVFRLHNTFFQDFFYQRGSMRFQKEALFPIQKQNLKRTAELFVVVYIFFIVVPTQLASNIVVAEHEKRFGFGMGLTQQLQFIELCACQVLRCCRTIGTIERTV